MSMSWTQALHRYDAISRISINFDIWQFNLLKFSSSVKYHHQSAVILHTFKSMQKWCNFNFSPNNKYWNNPILVRTMPIISLGQQHYYHSQLCSGDQVIQYFCLVKYFLHLVVHSQIAYSNLESSFHSYYRMELYIFNIFDSWLWMPTISAEIDKRQETLYIHIFPKTLIHIY